MTRSGGNLFFSFSFFWYNLSANKPCISVPPTVRHSCFPYTHLRVSHRYWPISAQHVHSSVHSFPAQILWQPSYTWASSRNLASQVCLQTTFSVEFVHHLYFTADFPQNNWHAVALGQTQFMTFKEEIVSYSFGMLKLYTKISKKI